MALVYADMKLCDIIVNEPTLIPVINRFGIRLGVGDKSIRTVCGENKLDTDFFLTILNTFINEEFFPEKRLKSFCAAQIVDYLTQTNHYYKRFQIPNIERHFNSFIGQSDPQNSNLNLIWKFFVEVKKELLDRIEDDHSRWFPHIKQLSIDEVHEEEGLRLPQYTDESDTLEEKLHDLKSLFVTHLSGDYDQNLCYAVMFAIYSLDKDISQHNRIRNRILRPMCDLLQKKEN